ncbi:MAG: glycosyltransferase family 2 protein [Candidatus Cloacimonetes bacterium]|nr:glycosyltransferase family 2 protein [Candidatus Cloacimonadota bacterium]
MSLDYSILILNYNGDFVLKRSIDHTLKMMDQCSLLGELIIVDNNSSDESRKIIKDYNNKIVPFLLNENLVLCAYNQAFNIAKGKILILLNNDEFIQENYIQNLIENFSKNTNLFLAVPKSIDEDSLEYQSGLIDADIKFGHILLKHSFTESEIDKRRSLPFGSLGAYCKDKLKLVGGFEKLLLPFYWEDVDLSYRARKIGFDIIYEPSAVTKHINQATISKFDRSFVIATNRRNKLLFFWLNVTDLNLWIYHILYFPFFLLKSLFVDKTLDYIKALTFGVNNFSEIYKEKQKRSKVFKLSDMNILLKKTNND